MMPKRLLNALLDKLVAGTITPEERGMLIEQLRAIEQDSERPAADRMAAILMRAALEVRSVHVVG